MSNTAAALRLIQIGVRVRVRRELRSGEALFGFRSLCAEEEVETGEDMRMVRTVRLHFALGIEQVCVGEYMVRFRPETFSVTVSCGGFQRSARPSLQQKKSSFRMPGRPVTINSKASNGLLCD